MTAVREVHLGRRTVAVVPPTRHDVRLRQSAVIVALHVLGQTVLDFKLSITQIIVSIVVCAAIEIGVTAHRDRVLAWPGSALLTGNGIALILRASGTVHGDWWSFRGVHFFVLAGVLSMLSKHLIRPWGGRHLFNPSNVGIVWTLLVIGPMHVFPQYLWWGPSTVGVGAAYLVIAVGAVWILPRVGMVAMAATFFAAFGALVASVAASGASFLAIWHDGPVRGWAYWQHVVLSPEVLVFVFFMMSDPRTAPRGRRGRVVYAAVTAVVAALLLSLQTTEFGVKVSILTSLTLACALVPLIDRITAPREAARAGRDARRGFRRRLQAPAVAALIIAVAAPIDAAALALDEHLILLERGLTGSGAQ